MDDPREVELSDRNGSSPRDRVQFMDFTKGFDQSQILAILSAGPPVTYPQLWNRIIDWDLCQKPIHSGIITRTGKWFSCGWGKHEFLIEEIMGMTQHESEQAGFMRVSGQGNMRGYVWKEASARQKRICMENGIVMMDAPDSKPIAPTELSLKYERKYA